MDEEKKDGPAQPVTITLRVPLEFGKQEPITELVLKPTSRAFKDMTLPITVDDSGGKKIDYQPYALAVIGLKMAGHVAAAQNLVDKMDPKDMRDLSMAVLGFFD